MKGEKAKPPKIKINVQHAYISSTCTATLYYFVIKINMNVADQSVACGASSPLHLCRKQKVNIMPISSRIYPTI